MVQPRDDLGFTEQPLLREPVGARAEDELEGDAAAEQRVFREEHLAHAAPSQGSLETITAEVGTGGQGRKHRRSLRGRTGGDDRGDVHRQVVVSIHPPDRDRAYHAVFDTAPHE